MEGQARGTSGLEPIAIIGMGCRFAGEASSVEGFWDTLRLGRREHGRVPASRYQASAWEHPSHERKGAINHDSGFFLAEDPSYFDASFFSITSKEAAGMNPVQRILLEVAYEAFENGSGKIGLMPVALAAAYTSLFSSSGASASSVLIVGSISQTLRATIDCSLAAGMQVSVAVDGEIWVNEMSSKYTRMKERIIPIHRDLDTTEIPSVVLQRVAWPTAAGFGLSEELDLAALPQILIDRGCTVSSVRLSRMLREAPRQLQANFHRAVDLLGADALSHAQAYSSFPVSRIADAVAHARDSGTRVIVDLQAPGKVPIVPALPDPTPPPAKNTYILVGGLGTLGIALGNTLVHSGARHLVFLSRSVAVRETQQITLKEPKIEVRASISCAAMLCLFRRWVVIDSLKAAEVQNWVSREMGAELSSFEFIEAQPVRVLAEKIATMSSSVVVA
ncbi:hypothetical protein AbraIFM66951_011270 [Aspergillus brasiliensis]|nr:hypothetical protein AbraIFM66951_011270 [Aspergillus brasiliensis]